MSSIPTELLWEKESFYCSEKVEYTISTESHKTSSFYELIKCLSAFATLGFLLMFAFSLAKMIDIHWAIGLVGLLGGIGLTGAIWLSNK